MANTLVYRTTTGTEPFYAASVAHLFKKDEYFSEFCFICSRATDHFGEHDDVEGVFYDFGTREYDTSIDHWSYVWPSMVKD